MAVDAKARLKEIIDSYLDKDGGSHIDTGIVASHLAQMKLFGIRQGVEFFPAQDNFGSQRKDFVDRVIKYNQLDTRLDSVWDYFLCDGQGMFYIRPTQNNYRLYYFRRHEYRSFYNIDGELDEVVIIYSYKVRQGLGYQQDIESDTISGPAGMGRGGSSVIFVCLLNVKLSKKHTQKVKFHSILITKPYKARLKHLKIHLDSFLALRFSTTLKVFLQKVSVSLMR